MRSRRITHRLCLVMALAHLSSGSAAAAPDAKPSPAPQAGAPKPAPAKSRLWAGSWVFDEDRAKKQTEIRTAISSITDEVPFFLEGYVADKLMKNTDIAPGLDVSAAGNTIVTKYIGAKTYEGPLDQWVHTDTAGVEIDVQFQERGKRLHQHFRAGNGGRKQSMRVLPNGRLVVEVEVYSKWLPKSLRFSLHYRRKK